MSSQLTSFVNPITGSLENLQGQLSQLAALHREAHTCLRSQGASMTAIGGKEAFIGDGAVGFSSLIEHYVAASEKHMGLLDQAVSTAGTCIHEIANATGSAASAFLDEGMVAHVLGRLTHDAFIQEGASAVQAILDDMHRMLDDIKSAGGDFFGHLFHGNIGGAIHDVGRGLSDMEHLASDALNLLNQVGQVLNPWAATISNAVGSCLKTVGSLMLKAGGAIGIASGAQNLQFIFNREKGKSSFSLDVGTSIWSKERERELGHIAGAPVSLTSKIEAGNVSAGVGIHQGENGDYYVGAEGSISALKASDNVLIGSKNLGLTAGVETEVAGADGFVGVHNNSVGAEIGLVGVSDTGSIGANIGGVNVGVDATIGLKAELGFQIGAHTEIKLPFISFGFSL